MMNTDKRTEERSCNCKNSKCMKLYCDCFSARVPCGKSCRCVGCQNTTFRETFQDKLSLEKKVPRQELIRMHKGCACRRSNCTKKYCDCFQSGILCRDTCKCVDCQNNQSLTNRRVIEELRNKGSEQSVNQSSINLYSLYISQNTEHLHSIIAQTNPLNLQENWLDECARILYTQSLTGNAGLMIDRFLQILNDLESTIGQQITFKQDFSEQMDEQQQLQKQRGKSNNQRFVDRGGELKQEPLKLQNSQSNMEEEDQSEMNDELDDESVKNSNQKSNNNQQDENGIKKEEE